MGRIRFRSFRSRFTRIQPLRGCGGLCKRCDPVRKQRVSWQRFYYNRNSATGANDPISKASGIPKSNDALQQFGGGVGGPIRRNRLWFFVDYEQQLENDPIQVINPAVAEESSNLPGNFGIPSGTPLPPPNAPYPVPGTDNAPDPTNPVYLQQVSNALNALNTNLGNHPRNKNDWSLRPGSTSSPVPSTACSSASI